MLKGFLRMLLLYKKYIILAYYQHSSTVFSDIPWSYKSYFLRPWIKNDDGIKTNFIKMFPDNVSKSWRQWFSTYSIFRGSR